MKEQKGQSSSYYLLAPVVLAAAQGAYAVEWNLGADIGAEHHSNARKSATDEESDVRQMLGVGFVAKEQTRTLELEADYRGLIERWTDDGQDDRETITGFAQVAWRPVEFLRLYANNERHDLTVDSAEAQTTDNSDTRDTSEVGAELSFRFTPVDTVGVAGVYREVNYQEGEGIDSERPGMLAFWRHDLTPVSAISLNAFAEQSEFDGIDQELDRTELYLSYEATLSRLEYKIDLGMTQLEVDGDTTALGATPIDDDKIEGELLRASAIYEHHTHNLQALVARVLTDSSVGMEDSGIIGGSFNPEDTNLEEFDVVTETQAYFAYRWNFAPSWHLGAAYRYSEDDYENLPNDEKRHELTMSLDYQATRTVGVGVYGGMQTWKFEETLTARDEDEKFYVGARVNWQLGRQWGATFGYEHETRDSDIAAAEYDNDMIYARLSYMLR